MKRYYTPFLKKDIQSVISALRSVPGIDVKDLSRAIGEIDDKNSDTVSYSFTMLFKLSTPPDNTAPCVSNINIGLQMIVNENFKVPNNTIGGNYKMQIYVEGIKEGRCYCCNWHLDIDESKDETKEYRYMHPKCHLTFGGKIMKDKIDNDLSYFGQLLLLTTPRIPCAPMDGILAIDFILHHFYKQETISAIIHDSKYRDAVKNSQERIWMPYYSSISSCFTRDGKNGMGIKYLPNLISK